MICKKRIITGLFCAILASVFISGTVCGEDAISVLSKLNLTDEQMQKLAELSQEYNPKMFELISGITYKATELELELKRENRFDTEEKAEEASERANEIVREFSKLYGELLKTRVEYMLDAKDVLTIEQKEKLISSLEFEMEVPEEMNTYQELDLLNVGLDLSRDQIRKILRYRTEMRISELEYKLKIEFKVLDLEEELTQDEVDPEKVNKTVMDITELVVDLLDEQIESFLKVKDVLTTEKKKKVLNMLMMKH
ncbi:MAG: Spy/CpxP family protein refolding chaperone [Planctomycetota bacterium]|jgi:Spy/CpxP family protein refolding chaperone